MKSGIVAAELYNEEGEQPMEYQPKQIGPEDQEIKDYEEENMMRLSKNKKKEFKANKKEYNADGFNEKDILDGIVDNKPKKKDKK